MTFVLTLFDRSIIDSELIKYTSKKTSTYDHYIYKYNEYTGIMNSVNDTYNVYKIDSIVCNSNYMLEKYTNVKAFAPPTIIDDVYKETVLETDHYKKIGNKEYVIQFMFDNYNAFQTLVQTYYKSLFEKIDFSSMHSFFEKNPTKTIIKDSIITKPAMHTKDNKSKYIVKNTSKYEHKTFGKSFERSRERSSDRFGGKIEHVNYSSSYRGSG